MSCPAIRYGRRTGNVNDLGVVVVDLVDDLRAQDLRLDPVFHPALQHLQRRIAGILHVGLGFRMELQHAEMALDDHQAGTNVSGLQGRVGDLVDEHAGSNLDQHRGHAHHRQITAHVGSQKCGKLRLQPVDINIGT